MADINIEAPGAPYIHDEGIYEQIISDIESSKEFHNEKSEVGERNYAWYKGEQWTEEQKAAHRIQGRIPYVFNEIQTKVDNILGSEKQLRFEAKAVPREQSDNTKADTLSFLIKWAEQVNDIDMVQSEIFQDAVIRGSGACVIRWDNSDVEYGYPSIERVPRNELYWDKNSRQPDLSDAQWMARVMKMTKLAAAEQYPQHLETIDSALVYSTEHTLYTVPSYKQEKVGKRGYWHLNEGRDLVTVIEYYEKVKVTKYIIVDEIGGKVYYETTYPEARDLFAGLVDGYTVNGTSIISDANESLVYMTTVSSSQIIQNIVIGDKLCERNLLSLPTYPYIVLFTYFSDGDFFAVVDNLILPQLFTNRLISQWDYSVGTSIKNAYTVKENLLRKGYTVEDLRRDIAKTGAVVPVIAHEAIAPLQGSNINPSLFQGINFSIDRMEAYGGGRNMMGQMESAGESGKAVLARTQQAGVARMTIFDRLSHWRRQVTELVSWWIVHYMTPGQMVRIIGNDETAMFMELDNYSIDTIKELKYDITITETNKSDAIKDRNFEQMWRLFSQIPALEPYEMMGLLLPFTSIPESQKDNIRATIEAQREYMQQVSQQQNLEKLQKEAEDSLVRRKLKDDLLKDEQYQTMDDARKKLKEDLEVQDALRMQAETERRG